MKLEEDGTPGDRPNAAIVEFEKRNFSGMFLNPFLNQRRLDSINIIGTFIHVQLPRSICGLNRFFSGIMAPSLTCEYWDKATDYQKKLCNKIFNACDADQSGGLLAFEFCCLLHQ